MAEAHPGAERRSAPPPRPAPAASARDPEPLGRAPEQGDVADRLGRRDAAAAAASRGGSDSKRRRKLRSIRPDSGIAVGQPEPARQLGGRQAARQLQQRERIAARLGRRSGRGPARRAAPAARRPAARARRRRASPSTTSSGRPASASAWLGLADGEHHRDPLREQAPRDERQRLRGPAVEPLRVVDQAHQRPLLGRLGQQAQHRQADEEVIRGGAVLQPEGDRAARPVAGRAAASSPSSMGAHS